MTTDSRPEPPGGSSHGTAPTPVVPMPPPPATPPPGASPSDASRVHAAPAAPTPRAPGTPARARRSRRAASASLTLTTVGALVAGTAVAVAALGGPRSEPPVYERPTELLDDRAVAPPAFALVTRAWSDDDADGLRGGTEAPLAGVVVRLETADARPARHPDGSVVAAATTGPDGTAVFDDVTAGVYRVRWTLPAGYALTTAVAAPGHALADSDAEPVDADPTQGLSGPVALSEPAELGPPDPADGVTADRLLRGVDVGATPAAEVLDAAQG